MENISKMIKSYRMFKGLTQESVAFDLGLSTNSYWKIENGATDINWNRLCQIVSYFGFVNVNEFLNFFQK